MLSVEVAPYGGGVGASADGSADVLTGGEPTFSRYAEVPYAAASTMKVAVLAALYREDIDLDQPVPVANEFVSVVAGARYGVSQEGDGDPEPWRVLGQRVPLRWLAERMVTHSSNLATNLCLDAVGAPAVERVWRDADAVGCSSPRGIEDFRGREAGINNLVTARGLRRLLDWLDPSVLALLQHNAHGVDLAAGLPADVRLASKNGWLRGLRHSVAVVHPHDAPPYTLAVCYTGSLGNGEDAGDPAATLLARISRYTWQHRHHLTPG